MGKEDNTKSGYILSRQWFDFTDKTKGMARPVHTALYLWLVELNNRLQWVNVFGLPMRKSMQRLGIKDCRTFKKTLSDLEKWGFIKLISKSRNQYTCSQISLVLKVRTDDFAYAKNAQAKTKVRVEKRNILQDIFDEEERKKRERNIKYY
jgi:hypothetical protein